MTIDTDSKFYAHTKQLFKEHQILKINNNFVLTFSAPILQLILYINCLNDKCIFYNICNYYIRTPVYRHYFAKYNLLFECICVLQTTSKVSLIKNFTFISVLHQR